MSDLGAVTLTITYDPKVVKATSVSPGTFMQQGGVTPVFVPKIDEATGRIDIAVSRGGTAPGATGTGLLAGLVFQAVARERRRSQSPARRWLRPVSRFRCNSRRRVR